MMIVSLPSLLSGTKTQHRLVGSGRLPARVSHLRLLLEQACRLLALQAHSLLHNDRKGAAQKGRQPTTQDGGKRNKRQDSEQRNAYGGWGAAARKTEEQTTKRERIEPAHIKQKSAHFTVEAKKTCKLELIFQTIRAEEELHSCAHRLIETAWLYFLFQINFPSFF